MSLLVRRLSLAALCFSCAAAFSSAATIVISEDDFDGGASGVALATNTSLSANIVADPTDATNDVAEIDIATGGVWGSYFQTRVDMAASGIAIGDTINYTYDVYVPSASPATNAGAQDRVSMIIRWGDNTGAGDPNPGNTTLDVDRYNTPGNPTNIPADTWVTISNSLMIPADNVAGGITTVSSFTPIWSHYDDQDDAAAGTTVYLDNWSITVETATVPEPTGLALMLGLFGGVVAFRRRFA